MKKRAFTLLEVVTSLGIIGAVVLTTTSLMQTSLRGITRTNTDTELTNKNAIAVRKMSETLRQAVTVTVTDSGKKVTYQLPKYSGVIDPVTGEKEILIPVTADGVDRSFTVNFTDGTIVDSTTGKAIVKKVAGKDPDPQSTQYNQAYVPFVYSTAGSSKAVTINLITLDRIGGERRYSRFKTTMVVRNSK